MAITAKFKFNGEECTAEVINAGEFDGNAWLVEIGLGYSSVYYIVEADSMQDCLDVFADSEHGHYINVDDCARGDYNENNSHYAGNDGHLVDTDNMLIHGFNIKATAPFKCQYYGQTNEYTLPSEGIDSKQWREFTDRHDEIKRDRAFSIAGGYESTRYRFKDQPIYMYYVYDKWLSIDNDSDMDDDGIVSVPIDDSDREVFPELAGVDIVRFRYSTELIQFVSLTQC